MPKMNGIHETSQWPYIKNNLSPIQWNLNGKTESFWSDKWNDQELVNIRHQVLKDESTAINTKFKEEKD